MIRLLFDADVDPAIAGAVKVRVPSAELVTAVEVGLRTASDPEVLDFAARTRRVIVSHD